MQGSWISVLVALGLVSGFSAGTARAAEVPAAELSVAELSEMEQLLAQLNFDPGVIDGEVDGRTRTAIRLYQEFAILPIDGEPSARLLRELRQISLVFAEMQEAKPEPEIATPAEPDPAPTAGVAAAESPPEAVPEIPELPSKPEAVAKPVEPEPAPEPEVTEPEPEQVAAKPADPPLGETPKVAPKAAPKVAPEEAAQATESPADPPTTPKAEVGFNIAGMIARLKHRDHVEAPASSTPASSTPAAPTTTPSPPTGRAPTDRAGRERTLIWKVQQELRRIGLDPGAPDGNMRTRTTAAIATYQRARGLPAGGRVTEALLARLEAEGTPSAPHSSGEATARGSVASQAAGIDAAPSNGYRAFQAGYRVAQSGNFDAAVKLYDRAIDSGDLALEHLAVALYNRANAYHYLGVMDRAIADYSAAIANKPGFPAAYYNRGFALDRKGEQVRAVEDFRTARDLGLQRLGVRSPDLPPPLL